jgi:hypothetical protein
MRFRTDEIASHHQSVRSFGVISSVTNLTPYIHSLSPLFSEALDRPDRLETERYASLTRSLFAPWYWRHGDVMLVTNGSRRSVKLGQGYAEFLCIRTRQILQKTQCHGFA